MWLKVLAMHAEHQSVISTSQSQHLKVRNLRSQILMFYVPQSFLLSYIPKVSIQHLFDYSLSVFFQTNVRSQILIASG